MSMDRPAHVWAVVDRYTRKIVADRYTLQPAIFWTRQEARDFVDLWIDRWRIVKLTEGAS